MDLRCGSDIVFAMAKFTINKNVLKKLRAARRLLARQLPQGLRKV
ncbi:hypothetical protein [Methanobrevibacter sp.]